MQDGLSQIDPFELADEGRSIGGTLDVASLERLAGELASRDGQIEYALTGSVGERGERYVSLALRGRVRLQCQRCLGGLDHEIDMTGIYQLLPEGASWPEGNEECDEVDVLESGPTLEVDRFVEDELLLALPASPRHDACGVPAASSDDISGEPVAQRSPFAALAGLKARGR